MVNNNLNNKPILVVGLPRSGTTWQFNILSQAKEVLPIFEPDNRPINPYSYYYLGSNHRFPINKGNNETKMLVFWYKIFKGGWKEGFTFKLLKYIYLSNIKVIENQIYEYSNFIIPPNKYINYFPKDQYVEELDKPISLEELKTSSKFLKEKSKYGILNIFSRNIAYN